MKNRLLPAAAATALAMSTLAAWAVVPGPTTLPYFGTIQEIHCGTVACQAQIPGFPISNGWVGIQIRGTPDPKADSLQVALTKQNKWQALVAAFGANRPVNFSILTTTPTVACNPDVCGMTGGLVAELQDIAE